MSYIQLSSLYLNRESTFVLIRACQWKKKTVSVFVPVVATQKGKQRAARKGEDPPAKKSRLSSLVDIDPESEEWKRVAEAKSSHFDEARLVRPLWIDWCVCVRAHEREREREREREKERGVVVVSSLLIICALLQEGLALRSVGCLSKASPFSFGSVMNLWCQFLNFIFPPIHGARQCESRAKPYRRE